MENKKERFLELVGKSEALSEQARVIREELDIVMMELGLGTTFQNPADKVVYQIVVPKGDFTYYKHIGYKRTNREGEGSGGTNVLSKKEATSLGFIL